MPNIPCIHPICWALRLDVKPRGKFVTVGGLGIPLQRPSVIPNRLSIHTHNTNEIDNHFAFFRGGTYNRGIQDSRIWDAVSPPITIIALRDSDAPTLDKLRLGAVQFLWRLGLGAGRG